MRFEEPALTAHDYLLAVADLQAQRGVELADVFVLMVAEAMAERGARRSDGPRQVSYETVAVDAVVRAYDLAVKRRDRRAQREILVQGLDLLTRWPSFLMDVTVMPDGAGRPEAAAGLPA